MKSLFTRQNKGYLMLEAIVLITITLSLGILGIQTALYFQKTIRKDIQIAKNIQNINKFCKNLKKILSSYKNTKITIKPEINFLSIFKEREKIIYIAYTNKAIKLYHKKNKKIFKWNGEKILFNPHFEEENICYMEIVFKSKYKNIKKTILID